MAIPRGFYSDWPFAIALYSWETSRGEAPSGWSELAEWQREAWRREYRDA